MKNLKKVLALVLALSTVFGLSATAGAAATDFNDYDEIQNKEAVEVMNALNVIGGHDTGDFKPTGYLTRAEMCKMVSYVMNGGNAPVLGTSTTYSYTDTAYSWAKDYIEYATSMGIVGGVGGGKFNPDGTLTGVQAAKMMLTAMGYDANVFGFGGAGWDVNVNRYANEAGLYQGLSDLQPNLPITRDQAAQLMYNAVLAGTVRKTWGQDMQTGEITQEYALNKSITLFSDKYDGHIYEGILNATGEYDLSSVDMGNGSGVNYSLANADGFVVNVDRFDNAPSTNNTPDNNTYFEYKDQDLTDLMGQYVKVLYNSKKGTVYGVHAEADKNTVLETAVSLNDYSGLTRKVKVDGKLYDLESDIQYVRGESVTTTAADYTNKARADKIVYVDNDGNGKFDVALITPVNVAEITFINDTNITFAPVASSSDAVNSRAQLVEDMELSEGLAIGDYAVMTYNEYADKDTLTKVEITNGTVKGVRNPVNAGTAPYNDYQIGETWNKVAEGFVANSAIGSTSTVDYVAVNNVLFYAKLTSGATLKDVAVIYEMAKPDASSNPFGRTDLTANVIFSDGSKKTVTVDALYPSVTGADENDGTFATGTQTEASYVGVPLSYKVNSDGSYSFYKLSNTPNNKAGFDSVALDVAANRATGEWRIGGNIVADEAVIIVRNNAAQNNVSSTGSETTHYVADANSLDGKITTLTGADFKKIAAGKFDPTDGSYTLIGKDSDGFSRVMFAVVEATTSNTTGDDTAGYNTADDKFTLGTVTGSNFAYLVDNSWTETIDGSNYNCFEVWDGTKTVILKEKATAAHYPVRTTIAYDPTDSEGVIKNVVAIQTIAGGYGVGGITTSATSNAIEIEGVTYEITNNTVILNVNDTDHVGVAGTATTVASESPKYSGNFIDNAYYYVNGANELEVIVVDVSKNAITGVTYELDPADVSAAALSTAFSTSVTNDVVITGSLSKPLGAITVPAGKTLTVKGDLTLRDTWTVNGTLVVEGTFNLNGQTLNGSGTVNGETIRLGSTIAGTTLNFKNAVISGPITITSGTLNVSGNVTNSVTNATITISGGALNVSGTVTGSLAVSGTANVTVNGTVTGNLTVDSTASGAITTGTVSGTVTNNSENADVTVGGQDTPYTVGQDVKVRAFNVVK